MKKALVRTSIFAILVAGFVWLGSAFTAHAQIAPTLTRGESGGSVTQLQQLLATEPILYPSGLVTGYFGPLTEAAVEQFQLQYNLAVDGIVGPNTALMLNNAMRTGIDIRVPNLDAEIEDISNNSITIEAQTVQPSRLYVHYDTRPITDSYTVGEFDISTVTGLRVMSPELSTEHTVRLPNLLSDTNYHIVVFAQDAAGNFSAEFLGPVDTD